MNNKTNNDTNRCGNQFQRSFPVIHPCEIEYVYNEKIGDREPIHHIGKVDDDQVICSTCFESFTFWIDLFKSHICRLRGIEQICNCGHKKGWHHANGKHNGKTLFCYGIGCLCEGFHV